MKIRTGPSGIHLFDRKTGYNILIDEITVPAIAWSKAPRQVSFALTNICDLNCYYCFAPKSKAILDYGKVTKWILELDANGCLGVGFGGGEPTLYKHLPKLCEFTAKNTGLAITLTTHTHRLNESMLRELAGNVNFIRVSMDGVFSTYESLRGKSFESFRKNVIAAKKIAPIGINYVVNSTTINDLDKAIEFAIELQAEELLLLPEQPNEHSLGIDITTNVALQDWVYKYKGIIQLTISEASSEGFPISNPFNKESSLQSYAHITAHGILKTTSFDIQGVVINNNGLIAALDDLKTI